MTSPHARRVTHALLIALWGLSCSRDAPAPPPAPPEAEPSRTDRRVYNLAKAPMERAVQAALPMRHDGLLGANLTPGIAPSAAPQLGAGRALRVTLVAGALGRPHARRAWRGVLVIARTFDASDAADQGLASALLVDACMADRAMRASAHRDTLARADELGLMRALRARATRWLLRAEAPQGQPHLLLERALALRACALPEDEATARERAANLTTRALAARGDDEAPEALARAVRAGEELLVLGEGDVGGELRAQLAAGAARLGALDAAALTGQARDVTLQALLYQRARTDDPKLDDLAARFAR